MTPLERLRLSTALTHAAAGAEMRLRSDCDEHIVVSHHPAADIDPCAMRRVVAASACPNNPDYSDRMFDIDVGGSLTDLGGGVFGSKLNNGEQRWLTSLLVPCVISRILDDVGVTGVPAEAMKATVKPDPDLGVTVFVISSNDPQYDASIDEVAAQAAAACFVEELRLSVEHVSQLRGSALGSQS